jgi:hypothetical protein
VIPFYFGLGGVVLLVIVGLTIDPAPADDPEFDDDWP